MIWNWIFDFGCQRLQRAPVLCKDCLCSIN